MTQTRIAYMPLATYPETIADGAIRTAVEFALAQGWALHVSAISVDIPRMSSSPVGGSLIGIPGMARTVEEKSRAECRRLQEFLQDAARSVHCVSREAAMGAASNVAATEARYFDLAVLPWSGETITAQEMSQAVLFGSGRPTILVPPSASTSRFDHIAIAWDGSRVAARALGDALPLLAEGGDVSVLTVQDEKALGGRDIAGTLASSLEKRGFQARPFGITLSGRTISMALQETALSEGAKVLVMGGFGHSRIRDFILGGATTGVFNELRLPVLLSH